MHQTNGYHTVQDTDNADWIEHNAPFACRHNKAWLSAGFYFWEKDLERAHQWGRFAYLRQHQNYVILRAELTLDNMLDLVGDPDHQRLMRDLVQVLKQENPAWKNLRTNPPLGKVIELLRLYQQKGRPGIFPFDSVRSQDMPKPYNVPFANGRPETTDLNPRIQICVFKKSTATLHSVRIVFPEHYV